MDYSLVTSHKEVPVARTKVLLAVDSTPFAQLITKCAQAEAPDLQVMYFTDEQGEALDSSETLELLMTIADTEPDIVIHATPEAEPDASMYSWVFDQFPRLEIVHIDANGIIRQIRQSISMSEFDNQARDRTSGNAVRRLFKAIRSSTEVGVRHAISVPPTSVDCAKLE